jgi:6-phosphogluconate dehydrogenase
MGANMVQRLMKGGHECVVFDLNPASVCELANDGAQGPRILPLSLLDRAAIAALTSPMLETGSPVIKPSSGSRTAGPSPLSGS